MVFPDQSEVGPASLFTAASAEASTQLGAHTQGVYSHPSESETTLSLGRLSVTVCLMVDNACEQAVLVYF